MTQDESRMLRDLANKIAQTPAPPKDAEAEEFIRRNIGNRPDALYLMTQTVLIQNMALQQAQQQIQDLQRGGPQRPAGEGGSGFLGGAGPQRQYGAPQYGAPQQYSAPLPQYAPAQSSDGPGFLRGAAQTAAGVAAGALAFEGIRSLFSHPGFGGMGGGSGFMGAPVEETVVNNYYDSPGPEEHGGRHFADTSDDTRDDDSGQLQQADYDDSNDNDSGDGGGFDDSGNDVA